MKKLIAAAVGLLALGAVATSANAAPLAGAKGLAVVQTEVSSNVIKVHGVHRSCRLDRFGWHRAPFPGARRYCGGPRRYWRKHRHHRRHHHRHHRRHHRH